jgi:hypothetical protein
MKHSLYSLVLAFALCCTASGCYTYTFDVGQGAQTGIENKKGNHYLIGGLAPISITDPAELARGADDYTVTITHTFVDGLLNVLTGGLYSPTTTIVTR